LVRAYNMRLYSQLAELAITVDGTEQVKQFREAMVVTAIPAKRKFQIYIDAPVLSQAEIFNGSVRFNFGVITA
jgi:hypothetical protein